MNSSKEQIQSFTSINRDAVNKAGKSGAEKRKITLQYIWDYYKLWIVGTIVLLSLIGYFTSIFYHRPADEILHISFVNFYDDVSEKSDFYQSFDHLVTAKAGDVRKEGSITFDSNYFFNLEKPSGAANTYYQKMIANLEAKTCDAVIGEFDNICGIGESGRLLDLRDDRVSGIYEKYQDRLINVEKDGMVVPVGIDISDSTVFLGMNGYKEACYLGISSNAGHLEMVELFLDYLDI